MNPTGWAGVAVILFIGTLCCLELGYRLANRKSENPDLAHEGIGGLEAAVFALLGLLLGFSFGGGTSRLESRRQLIIQEANAIGTAYLRLDMLPAGDQPASIPSPPSKRTDGASLTLPVQRPLDR